MKSLFLLVLAALLAPVTAGVGLADDVGFLECRVLPIPNLHDWHSGSGYTALECDLHGNAYIGAAYYGESASLIQYRADTGEFRLIARMQDFFHLPMNGTAIDTQSKIHTELCRDAEGKIYGGTKQGNEIFDTHPENGEDPTGYPSGHLFVYDPDKDEIRDLGPNILPNNGFEGGAIDRQRGRLYYSSSPTHHLIIYDIPSGRYFDKGEIDSASRYVVVDRKGRVFWPGWYGDVIMYDPVPDRMYQLLVRYEGLGEYLAPYGCALGPDGTKIYGGPLGGEWVLEYDLNSVTEGSISCRAVCRTVPERFKNHDIHTMITGPDGRVYWTAGSYDSQNVLPDGTHLMRYDPASGEAEDLGILRDSTWDEPHVVTGIQGSAFAPDGTLYLKKISAPYALIIVSREVVLR